jgi:hypothetical protein
MNLNERLLLILLLLLPPPWHGHSTTPSLSSVASSNPGTICSWDVAAGTGERGGESGGNVTLCDTTGENNTGWR